MSEVSDCWEPGHNTVNQKIIIIKNLRGPYSRLYPFIRERERERERVQCTIGHCIIIYSLALTMIVLHPCQLFVISDLRCINRRIVFLEGDMQECLSKRGSPGETIGLGIDSFLPLLHQEWSLPTTAGDDKETNAIKVHPCHLGSRAWRRERESERETVSERGRSLRPIHRIL